MPTLCMPRPQSVAVCCSVLQCVAVYCRVMQGVAVSRLGRVILSTPPLNANAVDANTVHNNTTMIFNTLQHTATHCNTLFHTNQSRLCATLCCSVDMQLHQRAMNILDRPDFCTLLQRGPIFVGCCKRAQRKQVSLTERAPRQSVSLPLIIGLFGKKSSCQIPCIFATL